MFIPLSNHSRSSILVAALIVALVPGGPKASIVRPENQSEEGVRVELPANGNLRVENLRGGVIVNIWKQDYVAVSAITDRGEARTSPAVIQRSDGLLSVRVARGGQGKSPNVNLVLSIPERSHAAILTQDGAVEVRGLSNALLIQSVSGEIRVEIAEGAGVDVIAESKTGSISSSFRDPAARPGAASQLRESIGGGGKNLRLYSQAGNIILAPLNSATATSVEGDVRGPGSVQPATVNLDRAGETRIVPQTPELSAPASQAPAGTPAKPTAGPEEISEGDVIRVDTQLVTVNVSVVDRNTSRGVNDLAVGDFHLFENGTEEQIQHFESASAPFNLMLLIDLSGSTTRVVELIKAAALHFVEAARPFDRIGVMTFAGKQVIVSPFTTDRQSLRARIAAIEKPDGSTKLYDSMAFAMGEVLREAKDSRRNAIVVMSDGLDSVLPNVTGEGSKLPFEEMIRLAKEFDGVVYSIWVDTQSYEPLSPLDIQQETFDLAHDQMKQLADAGGGIFYECEELKDLVGVYDRVVADLGMVYTLSYRPTNKARDGSWRTIRVNVSRQNAVARGKRGYYAD